MRACGALLLIKRCNAHLLFAKTARFLQLHPQVLHLALVLVLTHRRLNLGPRLAAAAAAELLRW